MKNILVPIGSSKNSVSNLQFAIDLAKEVDANVYMVAVFQELSLLGNAVEENEKIRKEAKNRLEKVLEQVKTKDVSVISHPLKGGVVEGVNRFATHIPIDLMVISPRSNDASEEVYLGNTSGMLLKGTSIPILIVPEGEVFKKPSSILMAFKNGTFRDKVLKPVTAFANYFNSEIHVLHVETPETTEKMKLVSENLKKLQTSYKKTKNATTFQAVVKYRKSHNPDMICVVRRKRGFFKLLMEKNIILKKEFSTDKPVLVLQVQK